MLILGVDLPDHTAADIALRLDHRADGLAERIGLALDGDRVNLPISPDEARALIGVLHESPGELRLRTALELELSVTSASTPEPRLRPMGSPSHRGAASVAVVVV